MDHLCRESTLGKPEFIVYPSYTSDQQTVSLVPRVSANWAEKPGYEAAVVLINCGVLAISTDIR